MTANMVIVARLQNSVEQVVKRIVKEVAAERPSERTLPPGISFSGMEADMVYLQPTIMF